MMPGQDVLFPWGDSRRFYSYTAYFRKVFGGRVQKLSADAGFGCPNRSPDRLSGGCTYCNNEAFNPSYCQTGKSITRQLEEGKAFHAWRYRRAMKYLAYFQPYSNTFAPLEVLRKVYEEALACPDVVGLVISTRPDCLADEVLDYLAGLSRTSFVHLEIGIESVYDETLKRIRRGHDFETTKDAFRRASVRGLRTGGHIILGLPGETRQMMKESAAILNSLGMHTLKFHQLQIIRGTEMEKQYRQQPAVFSLFGPDEYIEFVVDMIEILSPDIVLERFTAEAPPRLVVAPDWGQERGDALLRRIEAVMQNRNTWQGRLYKP